MAARCVAAPEQGFTANDKPLRRVEIFKYLGRLIAYDDTDVPAARRQLAHAHAVWGRLRKIIEKENVPAPVVGMFYQAVVAAVLLYGSESWAGVRPQADRDAAAQAREQMGLSQVCRPSARREAPTPPLLHTKAEG